jgi:small subunit ribosomal protein S6
MMLKPRMYEAMVILPGNTEQDTVDALIERFRTLLETQGATVHEARIWDKRKFAYEIKHVNEGIYLLFRFEGLPAAAEELRRVLGITEAVLRFRIFRLEPEEVAVLAQR